VRILAASFGIALPANVGGLVQQVAGVKPLG
jgi:hypothetical protein